MQCVCVCVCIVEYLCLYMYSPDLQYWILYIKQQGIKQRDITDFSLQSNKINWNQASTLFNDRVNHNINKFSRDFGRLLSFSCS